MVINLDLGKISTLTTYINTESFLLCHSSDVCLQPKTYCFDFRILLNWWYQIETADI